MKPRYPNPCKHCQLIVQVDSHDMYYCKNHSGHFADTPSLVRISDPKIFAADDLSGSVAFQHCGEWYNFNLNYQRAILSLLDHGILDKCDLDAMTK